MKKLMLLFVMFLASFVLIGCIPTPDAEVTITVTDYAIEVEVGDLISVSPTVKGATNGIFYTSSNEEIFTVSNGIVTGMSVGSATLTIGAVGTQVSATIAVTVIDPSAGGSDDLGDDDPIIIEDKYTIANGDQSLEVGEEVLLQVFKGAAVYNGPVIWMSNNDSVVTADSNGVITGVSAGSAKIVAIVASMSLTITVSVREGSVVVVLPTSLVISGNNFVNIDDSTALIATPNQGVMSMLVWASSDDTIAIVNGSGVVTGVTAGVVTITAVLADNMDVYDTFTIVIKEAGTSASPITAISIAGVREVLAGNKIKLSVTYTPSTEVATFTYSSSNESVATVDQNGWVMGVYGGAVQITATLVGDASKSATVSVTVIPLTEGFTITGATQVSYNQNIVLQAQAYPVGSNSAVVWTSSNTNVASVDSNGRVTGLAVGSTTITATSITSAAIKATHEVTVVDQMSITLNPTTINLTVGGTATISATVAAASLSDKSLVWTSSNESVATVDSSGKVTAKAAGSTNIIAKLNAANSIQAQTTVTVTAAALPTINISNASLSLIAGTTKTLTATVSNAANTSVTWTSSNAAAATVSSSGVVTGVAQGSATITATAVANTSVKATCVVTVTSAPSGSLVVSQSPEGSVSVGNPEAAQLYIRDSGGVALSRTECTFTSSNSTVATVSIYGTIIALKAGTTTINVTHPTKGTGTIVVTIGGGTPPVDPPAGTLTVTQDPSGTIAVGAQDHQLYARDSAGVSLSRTECTFTSSNSSVATVSAYGTISAIKAGTATITVSHTKGTGTIVLTIGGTTPVDPVDPPVGPIITTPATYVVNSTVSSKNLGLGVTQATVKATTKWVSYASPATQKVSVLEVTKATNKKIVVFKSIPNKYGWQLATITNAAAEYENKNPGWKVLAGVNGDFFDLGGTGVPPYQTSGPTVSDGEFYKTTGGMITLGFTNNGTNTTLLNSGATPARKMVLTVGAKKFDVANRNATPGANAISVYFGTWSSATAFNKKEVSAGSSKLYVVTAGTNQSVLANSATDFYGKGVVSGIPASATLDKGQFGILSNNATLNALLASGNTARVQWEYTGDMANITSATGASHTFIINNAIVTGLENQSLLNVRHPRTLIGQKADGTIVMVVVDGRQTSPQGYFMAGARESEMQAIMAYYRCVKAYNLDGGGSSTMIVRSGTTFGTPSAFTVVNTPNADAAGKITLRTNGNAIFVVAPR